MKKFSSRRRDQYHRNVGVRIWGAALIVLLVAAVIIWSYLPPPLPRVVRMGTGPEDAYYASFGGALSKEVAKHGIRLETVSTAGSVENIRLLMDGEIDVGLVQSGNLTDEQKNNLTSIASVSYEPLLVVRRAEWPANHIAGGRIAIGEQGSGVNALTRKLLADQGR